MNETRYRFEKTLLLSVVSILRLRCLKITHPFLNNSQMNSQGLGEPPGHKNEHREELKKYVKSSQMEDFLLP